MFGFGKKKAVALPLIEPPAPPLDISTHTEKSAPPMPKAAMPPAPKQAQTRVAAAIARLPALDTSIRPSVASQPPVLSHTAPETKPEVAPPTLVIAEEHEPDPAAVAELRAMYETKELEAAERKPEFVQHPALELEITQQPELLLAEHSPETGLELPEHPKQPELAAAQSALAKIAVEPQQPRTIPVTPEESHPPFFQPTPLRIDLPELPEMVEDTRTTRASELEREMLELDHMEQGIATKELRDKAVFGAPGKPSPKLAEQGIVTTTDLLEEVTQQNANLASIEERVDLQNQLIRQMIEYLHALSDLTKTTRTIS